MINILVVEDDVATRLAVCYQLKKLNANIYKARGLQEVKQALDSLGQKSLDHAVVDLMLAGGSPDGFVVIAEISKRYPKATVTILTVRNDQDALQNARKLPAVRQLITKPWNSEDLLQSVTECLSGEAVGLKLIGEIEGVGV